VSEIAICTDSSALLPREEVAHLAIEVVPVEITLDGEPYDEHAPEIDDFYERLSAGATATTSQPSPSAFARAYAAAAERGAREALSIHLDARVSGTVGAAELAARESPVPVQVVDTRTVSFGVGLCVRKAAGAVASGASAAEAALTAQRLGSTLRNLFAALDPPGGRVPSRAGGSVLTFADGKALPVAACEDTDDAVATMASLIEESEQRVHAAVGHAGAAAREAAGALAAALARSSVVADVERYRVGPAVGAHTGALSFGAFWWPAEEVRR
jgi:fatty acid-binding protein DegV